MRASPKSNPNNNDNNSKCSKILRIGYISEYPATSLNKLECLL